LIPNMTHFEKTNFHPQFSPESADRKTLDGLQRAETHVLHMLFSLKYYSFECKIMILVRHFYMVTIDSGYYTVLSPVPESLVLSESYFQLRICFSSIV
jgi:hypothetical protein